MFYAASAAYSFDVNSNKYHTATSKVGQAATVVRSIHMKFWTTFPNIVNLHVIIGQLGGRVNLLPEKLGNCFKYSKEAQSIDALRLFTISIII